MWTLLSGVFLGWALGANDAANVFGPAVTSNIIKFRKASILAALFIVLGAFAGGEAGIHTVGKLTHQTTMGAFTCMLIAASVVTIMTFLKFPVSTSQAVIGAVIGAGLSCGNLNIGQFIKVILCWIGTPIGGIIVSYLLYLLIAKILKHIRFNFFEIDSFIRYGLLICAAYGAYALGANNVANTTAVFVDAGIINPFWAIAIGSLSIVSGVLTYSKNVIRTIGNSIVPIDAFSALITLWASAAVVHFYAIVGVPVSSSQAILGAVLGIGIIKGLYVINIKTLSLICVAKVMTPILSISISYFVFSVFFSTPK